MQRWPRRALPSNLTPTGTRCIQITIPDDDEWERAIYAEVVTLAQWMRWERDLGKNGKPVADIWLKAIQTWKHCDTPKPPLPGGLIEDFEMPLRVDCDCNVFVTCCDGTEKQIATLDEVKALLQPTSSTGQPQPQPGGGCQSYAFQLDAAKSVVLPTLVNTGDTLTAEALKGSWSGAGIGGRWDCPDGTLFLGGSCFGGTEAYESGAPAPSIFAGRLLYYINGTYYDGIGTFTVPSGVVNQVVTLLANYDPADNRTGIVSGSIKVCNNQPVEWHHAIDLSLSPSIFAACGNGVYLPGSGFIDTMVMSGPNTYRGVNLCVSWTTPTTIRRVQYLCDTTFGANPQTVALVANPGSVLLFNVANVAAVHNYDTSYINQTGVTSLEFDDSVGENPGSGNPGGTLIISQVIIDGVGFDPFA